MTQAQKSFLFWTPRVFSILFILFVSIFALDVFSGVETIWKQILGFLIHLIPSYALIIGLIIAWRVEWFGALTYIGFSVWYVSLANQPHWSVILLLIGLPIVIGLIWLVGWIYREEIRGSLNKPE